MLETLLVTIETISFAIGLIAVTFIVVGVIKATCLYIFHHQGFTHTRAELGAHLVIALDFLIGKDIIDTFLLPNRSTQWEDLIHLATVVAIRIVLTYFLERELKEFWSDQKPFIEKMRDRKNPSRR